MPRDNIKCSQCNKTFPSGHEYRIHWEKHLDKFLKKQKQCEIPIGKRVLTILLGVIPKFIKRLL